MEKDKKTAEEKSKITSFAFCEDTEENEKMDQFLKDSIIQEADKLEEALNRDPGLTGVGVSDDLFDSIVARLKAEGAWEEEPETSAKEESRRSDSVRPEHAPAGDGQAGDRQADDEQTGDGQTGDGQPGDEQPGDSVGGEADLESARLQQMKQLYEMLPKEDQEALKLGRSVVQKKQRKQQRWQRRRRLVKHTSVAAAVLVVLFGLSMTSEANRKMAVNLWDGLMGNLGLMTFNDLVGADETVRSKTKEEIEAMNEIRDEMGIPMIEFSYLPEGMQYLMYEIADGEPWEAVMMYTYQEMIVNVKFNKIDMEGVSYNYTDGETALHDSFENQQGCQVKIWETNLGIEEETYLAEIEQDGVRYTINGMMSYEEMKKIMENVYFL